MESELSPCYLLQNFSSPILYIFLKLCYWLILFMYIAALD